MDPKLAIQVYQMSKTFGQRPYTFINPYIQDPRNQFQLDSAIFLIGLQDEQERSKKEQKALKKQVDLDKEEVDESITSGVKS